MIPEIPFVLRFLRDHEWGLGLTQCHVCLGHRDRGHSMDCELAAELERLGAFTKRSTAGVTQVQDLER